jgi:alpha-beta hydrolase superfamily lysophospholipase
MISERTAILKSFDGTDLFFRVFVPKRRDRRIHTKGLILAVHGFGEHSGCNAELAEHLCAHNLALASFDLRGHGKSGPRRGDAENFHAMVTDIIFMISHARAFFGVEKDSGEFFGVLGQNFGALLTIYAAAIMGKGCPALFLASPLLSMRQKTPTWKKLITQSLPRVAPILQLPRNLVSKTLSSDSTSITTPDPLVLHSVSARLEEILLHSIDSSRIQHALSLVQAPITVACGQHDTILDLDTIEALMPALGSEISEFVIIEEAGHKIFDKHATAQQQALQHIFSWAGIKDIKP